MPRLMPSPSAPLPIARRPTAPPSRNERLSSPLSRVPAVPPLPRGDRPRDPSSLPGRGRLRGQDLVELRKGGVDVRLVIDPDGRHDALAPVQPGDVIVVLG